MLRCFTILLYWVMISSAANPPSPLQTTGAKPGKSFANGTELRILGVGDSITVGYLSELDGGDGNGYRLQLLSDLSGNRVFYAGTEYYPATTMSNDYFAAWTGMTIKYIADHVNASLSQRPNVILLHAGTNDMNANNPNVTLYGTDPVAAAGRLGDLIDQILEQCPDAVILTALIIDTCASADQENRTHVFQSLIPSVVQKRADDGHRVLAVDFRSFGTARLRDCIHPSNDGYKVMGDYWYDFLTQVPVGWIQTPVGPDPDQNGAAASTTVPFQGPESLYILLFLTGLWFICL